ncbi:LysR family transcriptional regulator [Dactylosporangium sp. CA-092794]|uniref:LysR family transcriptional regulator n=1 Tax=Dactylosporangium sp. CA-092794 TaxID=3239929 RepID=UPI003D8C8318
MYDPVQLRSFLAVARSLSFTRAAEGLGAGQSTVSQHVRKLEDAVGRPLFARDTHGVELTADGEAMVGFAEDILAAQERARRHFAAAPMRGRVRLGVSDDLAATHLPRVLRDFRREHPSVEVVLTVDLSGTLHRELGAGRLDLVFAKRPGAAAGGGAEGPGGGGAEGPGGGRTVWRDRLVWIGAPGLRLDRDESVPLVAYPPPSIGRERALAALRGAGRPWRSACVSGSLAGLVAAAQAGLGVLAHSRGLVPPGLAPVPAGAGLPPLGEVEFVVAHRRAVPPPPVAALAAAIETAGPPS